MPLEDSPTLSDFEEGYTPPPDPKKGKKRTRILFGAVILLLLVLLGVNFMQSDMAAGISPKGTLSGYGEDEMGNPIQVEVLIFGTDIKVLSDENGFFSIENVPIGEQSVIVAYGAIATEVSVTVQSGKENTLGTVTVPTDLLIFVDE